MAKLRQIGDALRNPLGSARMSPVNGKPDSDRFVGNPQKIPLKGDQSTAQVPINAVTGEVGPGT
jgi:hypothetical protein